MGGTTAKACLVEDGIPVEKPGSEVGAGATIAMRMVGGNVSGAGYALRVPSLDIVEVGAGGGSIAWIDGGGALRVGPESASADPGPACYGRGGTQPTVTDANVVLGYINPDAIADAQLAIDAEAAAATIQRVIADPLGLPLLEAAYGITLVANATMMRALRAVSTERGRDPRRSSLIAFGGAGPLHAASLSASMGITKVVVPPYSGVFSALGLLLADFRQDYVRSIAQPLLEVSADTVLETFAELERTAAADAEAQGVPADSVRLERRVDLKYDYQIAEMTLPFPEDLRGDELAAVLTRAFSEEHEREFRYASNDPIDLINLRLRATAPASDLRFADLGRQGRAVGGSRAARSREAYFGPEVGSLTSPVVVRGDLTTPTEGPLIIEEPDTTVVVPRGWTAALDDGTGSVVITHESHAATADTAHADTAHADTAHADTAREATR
jgi:N-methylhydantoinase A